MKKRSQCAVSLVELLITLVVFSVIIMGIVNIDDFARTQVMRATKRTVLQNELSYAIEHMSKYVQQAAGSVANKAIVKTDEMTFTVNLVEGVRRYQRVGNELRTLIVGQSATQETMARHITQNTFTVPGLENGSQIEIVLTARYNPAAGVSLDNPEMTMRSTLYARSASAS